MTSSTPRVVSGGPVLSRWSRSRLRSASSGSMRPGHHGLDHRVPRSEVVLHGGAVAVAARLADVLERDIVDAALVHEDGGGVEDRLLPELAVHGAVGHPLDTRLYPGLIIDRVLTRNTCDLSSWADSRDTVGGAGIRPMFWGGGPARLATPERKPGDDRPAPPAIFPLNSPGNAGSGRCLPSAPCCAIDIMLLERDEQALRTAPVPRR